MKENKSRKRLSIDLDSHPDVRDMLIEAVEATGESFATLVISALRNELPKVIQTIQNERFYKTNKFLKKYPVVNSKTENHVEKEQKLTSKGFEHRPIRASDSLK